MEKLNLEGNKLYQKRARVALPILVRQAKAGQTIYYGDLAKEIGMPQAKNLNYPLGSIGKSLKELNDKWKGDIPQIQWIVVNQSTGLPGDGIEELIPNTKKRKEEFTPDTEKRKFSKLSTEEKNRIVKSKLTEIYSYGKWDLVLKELGLQPYTTDRAIIKKIKKLASTKKSFGGEGEQHKKLKLYIKENPNCVKVKLTELEAETEKGLPSGDSIDVFFENAKHWVGVEVKSEISREENICRGLYQCVKYQAVMEADLLTSNKDTKVRVILALGGSFPSSLIHIKNTLGIEVIDKIKKKK